MAKSRLQFTFTFLYFTVQYELVADKNEETFTDYNKLFLCSKKIEFSLSNKA